MKQEQEMALVHEASTFEQSSLKCSGREITGLGSRGDVASRAQSTLFSAQELMDLPLECLILSDQLCNPFLHGLVFCLKADHLLMAHQHSFG